VILTVMAQSGVPGYGGQYLAWTGTHWDLDGGNRPRRSSRSASAT
jgi:hypothetical protein